MKRRKPLALLAFLAVTSRTHSRDALTEMLYPGHDREQGYSDVRQTLSSLRRAIGEEWLMADPTGVRLKGGENLWVDVMDFRRLIEAAQGLLKAGDSVGLEKALSRAAALVRGPFLAGFFLKDSPEFEDWQSAEGESLGQEQAWVLEHLVGVLQSMEEYRAAIETCRKWLSLEASDESVHCRLMELYALAGRRSLALKQYERCRSILAKELGESPRRETRELRDRISRRCFELPGTRKAASPPEAPPPRSDPCLVPFVGREVELGLLEAALEDGRIGRGRVVVLVGEAGIGKTRLLEEAAARAQAAGARVTWGRCHEDTGLPPFWPWRQALGRLVRESRADSVRVWAGKRAAVLGELLDDLRDKLGARDAPVRLDNPESERFRLAEAVAHFLDAAAEEQPLVVILDDLHCADNATLHLLGFIARGLGTSRIALLAASRSVEPNPAHPLRGALGELSRERCFQRITLSALGKEQVAALAAAFADAEPSPGFAELLWERTRGNPFYIVESLRFRRLERERHTGHGAATVRHLPIPPSVRDLIRRQVRSLSPGCHRLLETAAELGSEFTLEVLGSVTGLPGPGLLEGLDEALQVQVLVEQPVNSGALRFGHPLIQETISADLTRSRRTELHAGIAAALEQYYGGESEAHAMELARHLALGQPLSPPEKLARFSLRAGEQALGDTDYEEAQRHFLRGLAAKGSTSDDAEKASLRFGLARSMVPAPTLYDPGDRSEVRTRAFEAMSAAFDFFVAAGDPKSALRIARHPLVVFDPGRASARSLFDRALSLAEPGSIDEGWLFRNKATLDLGLDGDQRNVRELLQKALQAAVRHGDHVLELRLTTCLLEIAMGCERPGAVQEKLQAALEMLSRVDDPISRFNIHFRAYHCVLGAGNPAAAKAHAMGMMSMAGRLRSAFHLDLARLVAVELAWIHGDWGAARAASDEALSGESRLLYYWHHLGFRARLEFELGGMEASGRYLERYIDELRRVGYGYDTGSAPVLLAQIFDLTGNPVLLEMARNAAAALVPQRPENGPRGLWLVQQAHRAIAILAITLADRDSARRARPWIAGTTGLSVPGFDPTRSRVLGLIDLTLGDTESAVKELEEALRDYEAQRPGPNYAWTASDLAAALLARGGEGDGERAAELLRGGLAAARRLGMAPLEKRIRRLVARAAAARRASSRSVRCDDTDLSAKTRDVHVTTRTVEPAPRLPVAGDSSNRRGGR